MPVPPVIVVSTSPSKSSALPITFNVTLAVLITLSALVSSPIMSTVVALV